MQLSYKNNMNLTKNQLSQLIKDILKKKELSSLDPLFVEYQIKQYFSQNPKAIQFVPENQIVKKSKEYKQIIKDIRHTLRRFHGLFQTKKTQNNFQVILEMLDTAKNSPDLAKVAQEILSIHASTLERTPFYKQIYHEIFSITGIPKSIIDLGCGLNPASIVFMHIIEEQKKLDYLAYDINVKERELLTAFFEKAHTLNPYVKGSSKYLNFLETQELHKIPKADVCFLFKVTDIADQGKGHKKSEEIIKAIKSKFVVLSFPTKTMSGKKMTAPYRNWVKYLCNRLGYSFHILEYPTEIVYVIEK